MCTCVLVHGHTRKVAQGSRTAIRRRTYGAPLLVMQPRAMHGDLPATMRGSDQPAVDASSTVRGAGTPLPVAPAIGGVRCLGHVNSVWGRFPGTYEPQIPTVQEIQREAASGRTPRRGARQWRPMELSPRWGRDPTHLSQVDRRAPGPSQGPDASVVACAESWPGTGRYRGTGPPSPASRAIATA